MLPSPRWPEQGGWVAFDPKGHVPKWESGTWTDFLIRARFLREVHLDTTGVSGLPQTIHIALVFTDSILKARLHQSVLFSKHVSELDHGHRVPNAALKLETGLKTQGVAGCCGCLRLLGYLLPSLEQLIWVTIKIRMNFKKIKSYVILHEF